MVTMNLRPKIKKSRQFNGTWQDKLDVYNVQTNQKVGAYYTNLMKSFHNYQCNEERRGDGMKMEIV